MQLMSSFFTTKFSRGCKNGWTHMRDTDCQTLCISDFCSGKLGSEIPHQNSRGNNKMLYLPTRVVTQDSESTVFGMGALVVCVVVLCTHRQQKDHLILLVWSNTFIDCYTPWAMLQPMTLQRRWLCRISTEVLQHLGSCCLQGIAKYLAEQGINLFSVLTAALQGQQVAFTTLLQQQNMFSELAKMGCIQICFFMSKQTTVRLCGHQETVENSL